ncbi:sensor histidine kinase [Paenibacillus dakarensis]|uniref:sensor histidine kinase n=1 Tax=Paenibacillus dakarensis TaxID=1527293 RepID=UPI0006D57245|nr:sensor histidine kinase [Paenibacillus dakarensis]
MRNRAGLRLKNMRIHNKIIVIFIPLIVLPLFLLGWISYNIYTDAVISNTKKNMLDESRLIVTRINTVLSNGESYANLAMLDLNKESWFKGDAAYLQQEEGQNYQLRNRVENKLDFGKIIFPDIESALFIDRNNNTYSTNPRITLNSNKGLTSKMYSELLSSNGRNVWFPMQYRDFWVTDPGLPVLTIGKKIIDTETMEPLGILIVNIKESTLSSIYGPVGPVQSNGYFIIDVNGAIISSMDKNKLLKPMEQSELFDIVAPVEKLSEVQNYNGESILLTSMAFGNMKWKLINEIPLQELTRETRQLSKVIVYIGTFCLLLTVLGAFILSQSIAVPIIRLAKHMGKIKDDTLNWLIPIQTTDEIGKLGSGFNQMLLRINDLMLKLKDEQKKKREFELALVQEQIKPHFFYNSLDLIYVLCQENESATAGKATKALADFYRVALSNGKEVITIREEIRNLHSYLLIQSTRYADLFDFQIDIPNELLNYPIPKLTLQPLVENSIYHGLKEKEGFGHIHISGSKDENSLVLRVRDDGLGFPADGELSRLTEKDQSASFGLKSVDERIKLYYGEHYGVRIFSIPGQGAEVTIEIALSLKGEE